MADKTIDTLDALPSALSVTSKFIVAESGSDVLKRATGQQVKDFVGGGTAAATEFTPAGAVSATTVQAAIEELDAEKLPLTGGKLTGALNFSPGADQYSYNRSTDASNYERGFMRWASNVLEIGTEAGGTGTLRNVKLVLGNNSIDTLTAVHMAFKVSGVTNHFAIDANNGVKVLSIRGYGWSSTTDATAAADTMLSRPSAKIIQPNDAAGGGAGIEMIEMTAPANPATKKVRIYAEDNGSGKTRLMALFATGGAVQIAIEL